MSTEEFRRRAIFVTARMSSAAVAAVSQLKAAREDAG
jgi:hypothetical protein